MIYSHTDPVITRALYLKARLGVVVEGVYEDEAGNETTRDGTEADSLNDALGGLPSFVYLDGNRSQFESAPGSYHGGHLHHKTLIIDDDRVLTGSYNWSMGARDTNLEVLFDFQSPLVSAVFVEEFDRIVSEAALAPRPLPPGDASPAPRLRLLAGRICWEGSVPGRGFTVFSGAGPFFRAEHFRPENPGGEGCVELHERTRHSSGVASGKTHILAPQTISDDIANYEFDLTHARLPYGPRQDRLTDLRSLPCEDVARCREMRLLRLDLAKGFLETHTEGPVFRSVRFWTRRGMTLPLPLEFASGIHRFPPQSGAPGDGFAFVLDEDSVYHAACFQSGESLSGPPALFLEFFEWEFGTRPECLRLD